MIAIASASLGVVNLVVVCGNIFVLYVLSSQKSLQTPTNSIVLSLTISDLLLGLLILPFSIMQEHRNHWEFGETWCTIWLALDVWFSTASIYNLLAISFDRYMAVRQPIKYPIISSKKVIRLLISAVWAVSSLLACSLLVLDTLTKRDEPRQVCIPLHLPDSYIIFSSLFSFILPAVIMVVLNVCIFRTVLTTSRSRCVSVKSGATMRVHRGHSDVNTNKKCALSRSRRAIAEAHEGAASESSFPVTPELGIRKVEIPSDIVSATSPTLNGYKHGNVSPLVHSAEHSPPSSVKEERTRAIGAFLNHVVVITAVPSKKQRNELFNHIPGIRPHRPSMRTELRVARTTAVVVAAFVLCWFPFTTIYVVQAYSVCPISTGCIPDWLFVLAFWLGYSNSAVNPLLYAAFSRDFRAAFRKVLLRPASFRRM